MFMWYLIIFSIIFLFLYLRHTIEAQKVVSNALVLSKRQKILNSILIWTIPFVWYYLMKDFIRIDRRTMTKKRRDRLIRKQSGGFYESGLGHGGGTG